MSRVSSFARRDMESLEQRRLLASAVIGFVFNDLNFNGKLDGHEGSEPGVNGQTVYADYNNNRKLDAAEPRTTTFNDDGAFKLDNVAPGTYPIRQVIGQQWNQSFPLQDYGHWVTVGTNQTVATPNFGAYAKQGNVGGVFGVLFRDNNGNGARDAGEIGLGNRTVFVDYNNNKRLDAAEPRAISLADGKFQINNVLATGVGRVPVRQILPDDWEQTTPPGIAGGSATYNTTPVVGTAAWVKVAPGAVTIPSTTEPSQNTLFGSRRYAKQITVPVFADTMIRSDLEVRRNDNHGKEAELLVGTDRETEWGAPDAMRTLLRFDLSNVFAPRGIASAKIQLTYRDAINGPPSLKLNVHRLLGNWTEGNGCENGSIPGSTNVDDATGVDWLNQPAYHPTPVTSVTINHKLTPGEKVNLDVTALVQQSLNSPSNGVVIRNPINGFGSVDPGGEWGRFYQVAFWSKEGEQFLGGVAPKLIIVRN